ncbi:MAG: amino acid ABC transporter substrate-binding protein [Chromatiales bacterium]|nr:MAG: amino acid ABC transporter substrate-binding protein [Chromatiales bacterium]
MALLLAPAGLFAQEVAKIGATMSQTGKYAEFGIEAMQGLEMFISDVNGRGGASGARVELIVYDDQSDRDTTARLYEKLIAEDKVDFLVGPYGTSLTLAATEVAERYDVPIVVTGSGMNIFERGMRNVFGLYTPAPEIMRPILDLAKEKGLSRIAMAYADNEAPTSMAEGVRSKVAQYGMELVLDESYDRNAMEADKLDGLIARMAAAQPDVAIFGSYINDSVGLLKAAKAAGFAPDIMVFSYGPALYDFGAAVGVENAEGVMATSQWKRGQHMPGAFDFSFRFKKLTGRNASYPAAGAYASGQVIEAAARLAAAAGKRRDKDEIRNQLRTMKFTSLLGPYRVDDTGLQTGKPIFIIQWQEGRRRLVYPDELARYELIYPFPAWESR